MKAPRISTEISKKLEMTIGKRCDEKQIISFRTLSLDSESGARVSTNYWNGFYGVPKI